MEPLLKSYKFLSQTNLLYYLAISISDISSEVIKSGTERGLSTTVIITAFPRAGQAWKPKCPLAGEGIHKMWCICRREYRVLRKREIRTRSAACMNPRCLHAMWTKTMTIRNNMTFSPHIQVTLCNGLWKAGKLFTQMLEP